MRRFVVLVDGTPERGDGQRDVSTPPRPSGGGVLFVSAGALRYRGSSGTVTTLPPV